MPKMGPGVRAKAGYTLLEIMISVLITSIMVTSVMTVALTAKQGGGKADRKMIAAEAVRELQSRLRNYARDQTGDTNGIAAPGGSWMMPGDSCGGCTYAMQPGTHTITGILPGWFEAAPYSGTLKYIVQAGSPPRVEFAVDWVDP